MHWYIAQVYTGEERKVAERLIGLFPTWSHHLLPGYLLVQAAEPPWSARYAEGVVRLLPFSDRPQSIHGDVVLALQETCRAFEEAAAPKDSKPDQPIAGMARKLVANLFASAGFSVKIASSRVELDEYPPRSSAPRGARRNHGHDARRLRAGA